MDSIKPLSPKDITPTTAVQVPVNNDISMFGYTITSMDISIVAQFLIMFIISALLFQKILKPIFFNKKLLEVIETRYNDKVEENLVLKIEKSKLEYETSVLEKIILRGEK